MKLRLKTKISLFDLLSKLVLAVIMLILLPLIIERINLRQIDNSLIESREKIINQISRIGIEPFISTDSINDFGSYNILKEEFISLEKTDIKEDLNYIEVTKRLIDDDQITYRTINYTFMVDGQKYLLEIGKSLSSILQTKKNLYSVIVIFFVVVIVITFLSDLLFHQVLLHPLGIITDKLKEISDPFHFDMTPVKTSTADFERLDKTLMDLMTQINKLFQIEKEITINISHDLLTPISVLRIKLENLLLIENLDNEIIRKIEESLKTLYRLQSLVNSMLMIARIESRQYLINDSFMVTDVLKEIVEELSPLAEDKGLTIISKFESDFNFTKANRSLIFSMFYNVINNAIKNTESGGAVVLKSHLDSKKFNVTISDNGKGMNETQTNLLFHRFKNRIGSDIEGTGIGLAITKSVADYHGIEIHVSSQPGKGTSFNFVIFQNK